MSAWLLSHRIVRKNNNVVAVTAIPLKGFCINHFYLRVLSHNLFQIFQFVPETSFWTMVIFTYFPTFERLQTTLNLYVQAQEGHWLK